MATSRMAACLLLLALLKDSQQFYDDSFMQEGDDPSCDSGFIRCSSGSECIHHSVLCNNVRNCIDGEDEDTAWCALYRVDIGICFETGPKSCTVFDAYDDCLSWDALCGHLCSPDLLPDVCAAFNNGVLPAAARKEEPEPLLSQIVNRELISFMSIANCTLEKFSALTNQTSSCPQLYIPIGKTCLAPLPFVVTWPDAHIACQSIAGKLFVVESLEVFTEVIQFLVKADFSSNFWIGGFYDMEKDDWVWSSGPKMPPSTPYWAVKHNIACVTRQSPKLGALPGCFHYQQAPTSQGAGYCAALQFEYMYYISDEGCFQKKQPLCIH